MAVSVVQLFAPTELDNAGVVIYTAPTSPASTVVGQGRVRFTNTSGAARSITAYAVPAGGTADSTNCFMNAETVAQNEHLDVDLPVLGPGDFFEALADVTTSVTVFALDGVIFS